jgi:hypothetical protein
MINFMDLVGTQAPGANICTRRYDEESGITWLIGNSLDAIAIGAGMRGHCPECSTALARQSDDGRYYLAIDKDGELMDMGMQT